MAEGADHPPQAYILAEKSVNAYALLKKSTSFLLKIVSVVGKIAALPPCTEVPTAPLDPDTAQPLV